MIDVLTVARAHPSTDHGGRGHTLDEVDMPASALGGTVAEQLAVLVAPSTGRFRPHGDPVGSRVRRGTVIGHVTGGGGRADAVHAPADAEVADLLVRPGQLVYRGQGLAWLRRPAAEAAA